MWFSSGSVIFLLALSCVSSVGGQKLNVVPDMFRSYVNEFPELQTLNILGNISEVLFSTTKNEASVHLGSYLYLSTYDFIIVGSGPAGCVLANRLSANPQWTVLLIEAGSPESVIQSIPLATGLSTSSKYVRKYFFERNPGACLSEWACESHPVLPFNLFFLYHPISDIVDKECPFHSGVALGGSSVVNNLLYTRGNREDFDKWTTMGIEGWSWDDVLPYFERVERRRSQFSLDSDEENRSDGPLNIEQPGYTTALLPMYLRAGQELGHRLIDYKRGSQIGMGVAQGTSRDGRRVSAASAYIHPIYKDRPNLHIMTSTLATRILIDEGTKSAFAVRYKSDGVEKTVTADKEIILSAGAIGSAHLLMLSGVGPRRVLEKAKVPVVHELPVGRTFYTNVAVHAPHFLVNTSSLTLHIKRIGLKNFLQFQSGSGVLASFTGTEAVGYTKTPFSDLPASQPDVELQFVSAGIQSDLGMGFRKAYQIKESVYEETFKPIESPENDVWSTIIMNLHSNTSGYMKLVDDDINTDPILNYPFFEDPKEIKSLVYGIKEAMKVAQTETFRMIAARRHDVPLTSCSYYDQDSDAYWECYIRHVTVVAPQMVATNKMGPSDDPSAVVDPQLRVRGIRNLRVADTSVIPTTISGHLQAASYMIGEKLAASLKRQWKSSAGHDIPSAGHVDDGEGEDVIEFD